MKIVDRLFEIFFAVSDLFFESIFSAIRDASEVVAASALNDDDKKENSDFYFH